MELVDSYLAFIEELEKLKDVTRCSWTASGRRESTAEHSWLLAVFAAIMLNEFPELDARKTITMALIHDIGELYVGDISASDHPDPALKYNAESDGVQKVTSILPESLKKQLVQLWEEYEQGDTDGARLVKALDKAETILQHNAGKTPADFDFDFNLDYGKHLFTGPDILVQMRKRLDAETRRRMEMQTFRNDERI